MYWWLNMVQRFHELGGELWFVRDNPCATGYTVEELQSMSVPSLAKQIVCYTDPWDEGQQGTPPQGHPDHGAAARNRNAEASWELPWRCAVSVRDPHLAAVPLG